MKNIRDLFEGNNFMTPVILRYGETQKFFYELSTSYTKFMGLSMFGVTVINKATLAREYDISTCLNSRQDAENYIENLDNLTEGQKNETL